MAERIIVMGGRGGGAIAAEAILALTDSGVPIELAGFLNDEVRRGTTIGSSTVLGPFEAWRDQGDDARFLAPLHKVKEMSRRMRRVRELGIPDDRWSRIVDPRANVARDVSIGEGSLISGLASVQPAVTIGDHAAIRSGAVVGHDVAIGDWCFVGINASVCGYVRLEEGAYVGAGAAVREGVRVGRFAIVGLGAVVVDDVPDGAIVGGIPARVLDVIDPSLETASAATRL